MKLIKIKYIVAAIFFSSITISFSCRKLVEVTAPTTSVTGASVFTTDATAIAVMTGMYAKLSSSSFSTAGGIASLSFFGGLSADEFTLANAGASNAIFLAYYRNNLSASANGWEYWNNIYPIIFTCNSVIDGVTLSSSLTPTVKSQLLGEAKFMRAFGYFYLVNLYGDVPLVTGIDWKTNSLLGRSPRNAVYDQVKSDLKDAEALLSDKYLKVDLINTYATGAEERVRPTKWAAAALLARVFLFNEEWANAENEASSVINNSTLYSLASLSGAFLKNSREAILQYQPVSTGENTKDAAVFIIPTSGPSIFNPVSIRTGLLNSFEAGDQRKTNWINSVTVGGITYYYPYKYKISAVNSPIGEYQMALRLGEQYLIRSEARARLGNFSGAQSDLNHIRLRAGLGNTAANDQSSLLSAILHERQVELFSEYGHRWFDLKRTKNVDAIMSVVTVQKGGTWQSFKQLYPIPNSDIVKDPNINQNMGY